MLKLEKIIGRVESGLGKGKYFVSLEPYYQQFKDKLGIEPYKGTLNIRVNTAEFQGLIEDRERIIINGFRTETSTYGNVVAYKVKVNSVEAAILIPERTSHEKGLIEIISGINFGERFGLKEGDSVEICINRN